MMKHHKIQLRPKTVVRVTIGNIIYTECEWAVYKTSLISSLHKHHMQKKNTNEGKKKLRFKIQWLRRWFIQQINTCYERCYFKERNLEHMILYLYNDKKRPFTCLSYNSEMIPLEWLELSRQLHTRHVISTILQKISFENNNNSNNNNNNNTNQTQEEIP